jgi:hypothetical protein
MKVNYDLAKNAANLAKHGVALELATNLDWDSALTWLDTRCDYGEPRMSALVLLRTRLYFVAFVDRADERRIITLRKANSREVKRYADQN